MTFWWSAEIEGVFVCDIKTEEFATLEILTYRKMLHIGTSILRKSVGLKILVQSFVYSNFYHCIVALYFSLAQSSQKIGPLYVVFPF